MKFLWYHIIQKKKKQKWGQNIYKLCDILNEANWM